VFVENAFDFVDDSRSLCYQMLSKIGKLSNLSVLWVSGENAANAVGSLPTSEPFSVVPEEFAEGIGVAFIGLMHGGIVGLNNDDFGAMGLLEFFEEPVVKAADFDNGHVATIFSGFFDESGEKFVNVVTIGTDLAFLDDIALFISDIEGQLVFVLIDSKVQHGGLLKLKGL